MYFVGLGVYELYTVALLLETNSNPYTVNIDILIQIHKSIIFVMTVVLLE